MTQKVFKYWKTKTHMTIPDIARHENISRQGCRLRIIKGWDPSKEYFPSKVRRKRKMNNDVLNS